MSEPIKDSEPGFRDEPFTVSEKVSSKLKEFMLIEKLTKDG